MLKTTQAIKMLAFAGAAGGAEAIAPVCARAMQESCDLFLLAKGNAIDVFKNKGLKTKEFPAFNNDLLGSLVNERFGSMPDIVFTSATSLPTLDMTERYLWRWAKEKGIPSAGLVDQWHDYALRFSGTSESEKLAYLPDLIFVMDALAKDEMAKEGIPPDRILITGQPAFEAFLNNYKDAFRRREEIRRSAMKIPDGSTAVLFIAESLKKDFGRKLGYDEDSTLEFLGEQLESIASGNRDKDIRLLIKLHPENKKEEFMWALERWPALKKQILEKELTPYEAVAASDIVVGMTSILLVESVMAGRSVISLQLDSASGSRLAATKSGAIPFIKSRAAAEKVLYRAVCDEAYKKDYLEKQARWEIVKNGAEKCLESLRGMLARRPRSL